MIRFSPDSLLEAVVRPLAMALPNGGVYVETIAPDFRFVFVVLLLLAWSALAIRRSRHAAPVPGRSASSLLLLCTGSFLPWLATTGNGRYFVPVLLLVGPLAVALVYTLPISRLRRLLIVALMLGLQGFLVWEVAPWNSWGLVHWGRAPAFAVTVPEDLRSQPATYVVPGGLSYSLIAPSFHPDSRWVGLAVKRPSDPSRIDGQRVREILAQAQPVRLVAASMAGELALASPPPAYLEALDESLQPWGLKVMPQACRILASDGLTAVGRDAASQRANDAASRRGFWVCELQRIPVATAEPAPPPEVEATFEKIEASCPRLFPRHEAATLRLPFGARRAYPTSDTRIYVLDDGRVMYKYMRALNMELVGTVPDILAGRVVFDCRNIRGRVGLPWEREI